MTSPDFPPRTITLYVAPGEDLTIDGEDEFAPYELAGIYSEAQARVFADVEVMETCPKCGASLSPEEGEPT